MRHTRIESSATGRSERLDANGELRALPDLRLGHLRRLTDGTGVLQHAVLDIACYEDGYTTDDNARALLLMALLAGHDGPWRQHVHRLAPCYRSFLQHAFDPGTRRFRGFMGYDRRWIELVGTEETQGRALHALGAMAARWPESMGREWAASLFATAAPVTGEFTSPRSWAFTLLGLFELLGTGFATPDLERLRDLLADRMLRLPTRDDPILLRSLLEAGADRGDPAMIEAGVAGLEAADRPRVDGRPVDVQALVDATDAAWRATGDASWRDEAHLTFDWFLGGNRLRQPVCIPERGACRDGLTADGVRPDCGAASTLAYLLALRTLSGSPARS